MLILVSNDDGVDSPGIRVLARTLRRIRGSEVVIVAPDREQSASSHALTLHRPLRARRVSKNIFAVDGTPTDAVSLAVNSLLKKRPALLVSGINRGANLGEDVHYSGTVSAALEGAILGIPAIALSMVGQGPFKFDNAARFALRLARVVLKKSLPPGVVLNVNIPNLKPSEILGVAITRLGKHNYGGVIIQKVDPRGRPYYWIGGSPDEFEHRPGSDCQAFLERKISITPIKIDLTDFSFLEKLKKWDI